MTKKNWEIQSKLIWEQKNIHRKLTASISCLTSDSESFVPSLGRPAFNSSKVIVPLLSVSIDLNISFSPTISSSERFSAITYSKCNNISKYVPAVLAVLNIISLLLFILECLVYVISHIEWPSTRSRCPWT